MITHSTTTDAKRPAPRKSDSVDEGKLIHVQMGIYLTDGSGLHLTATIRVDALEERASDPTAQEELFPELQKARCMSNKYKHTEISKCVSCTRRKQGDVCRFQNIRYIMKDSQGLFIVQQSRIRLISIGEVKGIAFSQTVSHEEEDIEYPTKWNVDLTADRASTSKVRHQIVNYPKLSLTSCSVPFHKHCSLHSERKRNTWISMG